MVYKWTEEQTPLFLEQFKKYPTLWDYKLDSYKNRILRTNAIKSLIRDLNIPGVKEDDVKRKIKTIRTRYTCELSKINRSKKTACSAEEVYVPSLFWFKQADEFLNAVCLPRENSLDLISNSELIIKDEYPEQEEGEEEQEILKANHSAPQKANSEMTFAETSSTLRIRKRSSDTSRNKAKKHFKVMTDDHRETDENEFDLFCRSLAVQLKNMPIHQALICQQKLQSVMVQERLQLISTSSPLHSPYHFVDVSEQSSHSEL